MTLDFPNTILEFAARFSTPAACREYLSAVRWPNGFQCPYDGTGEKTYIETRNLWECQEGHQISVTADTIMHKSHIPLTKWFWAAYLVSTQTPGISSVVLSRQLGVHQESAYMMLQRLRAGMVDPDRSQLTGTVEVDETFISAGRVRKVRAGRGSGKPIVVAAVEVHGPYAGRVRLRRINDASEEELASFIADHVQLDSTVITDGWMGYANVGNYGYRHIVREGETSVDVAEQMMHIHRVFSNLKAWIIGTHHGVSSKHLQAYLNEFAFRYNRRGNPMAAFLAALQIGSKVEGPEYEQLYGVGELQGWIHPNPLVATETTR